MKLHRDLGLRRKPGGFSPADCGMRWRMAARCSRAPWRSTRLAWAASAATCTGVGARDGTGAGLSAGRPWSEPRIAGRSRLRPGLSDPSARGRCNVSWRSARDRKPWSARTLRWPAGPCRSIKARSGIRCRKHVKGDVHANGVGSLWSTLERAHKDTVRKLGTRHLNRHVREFAGRHNPRERDTAERGARVSPDSELLTRPEGKSFGTVLADAPTPRARQPQHIDDCRAARRSRWRKPPPCVTRLARAEGLGLPVLDRSGGGQAAQGRRAGRSGSRIPLPRRDGDGPVRSARRRCGITGRRLLRWAAPVRRHRRGCRMARAERDWKRACGSTPRCEELKRPLPGQSGSAMSGP